MIQVVVKSMAGTVADAQSALDKTLSTRAGEIAAAANAASRGRGIVGGKARNVHWIPVRLMNRKYAFVLSTTASMIYYRTDR